MSHDGRIVFLEAEVKRLQADNEALRREVAELRRGEGRAE